MVLGDVGARVVSVELRGFDTREGQRTAHDALMRRLDAGLGALLRDLAAHEHGSTATGLLF